MGCQRRTPHRGVATSGDWTPRRGVPTFSALEEFYTLADLENWDVAGKVEGHPIRLGVFGDPVAHSLSPKMQNAALEKSELAMRYAPFQIKGEELQAALRLLPSLGFVGVNLTIPHKITAAGMVDEIDGFARRVGAINTVRVEGEKLHGSNTDGRGFARAVRSEFAVDLRDLRVLLLGVGGAGRAIAMQCAAEGCERLVLVNRTKGKADQFAAELKQSFADTRVAGPVARLAVIPWDEASLRFQIGNSDLLVNATSLGLRHSDPSPIPASLLAPHLMVYDTVYAHSRTALLAAAAETGARAANGLSMLLDQGALSFETWFDRDAPIEAMRAAIL